MTESDLQLLKNSIDKTVRILCCNGETMLAKVLFVCDEEQDLIYDLVSTDKESQYEKHDQQPAYLIRFCEIKAVEVVTDYV